MRRSIAQVATDSPARYAKQLAAHLGRKIAVTETASGPVLHFATGDAALLESAGDQLVLHAAAADAERLTRVQDVVGGHLERFGARNELVVRWQPTEHSPAALDEALHSP